MENEVKDLVVNEEVIEAVEDVAVKDSSKVLKKLGAIGLIVGGGYLVYKYGVKPIVKKIKDKKEAGDDIIDAAELVESEVVDE